MSGIARILAARGAAVTGSDPTPTALTEALHDLGIVVDHVQDGRAIGPQTEFVIHTAAVAATNPDLVRAKQLGIPTLKYAEAVGQLMRGRRGIGVAGTHGKTTTSSMMAHVLAVAGKQPGFLIGGTPRNLGTNAAAGDGAFFVVEACEYDRSFLHLAPAMGIVTNIEADHLDYYKDLGEIWHAFGEFAALIPPDGVVVVNGDDSACVAAIRETATCPVVTFGICPGNLDWRAEVIDHIDGCPRFTLHYQGAAMLDITMKIPGWQNVANATGVAALAAWIGIPLDTIRAGLESFVGVERRFDLRGYWRGVPVIDDYAHHPTEIAATLAAARQKFPERRLWVAFQPHQATRTRMLFEEFADALALADRVLLFDIFAARESTVNPDNRALAVALTEAVRQRHTEASHFDSLAAAVAHLRWGLESDVAIFTLGAGNIYEIADDLTAPNRCAS